METQKMPIPLRPIEPPTPIRPKRRVPLLPQAVVASDPSVAALKTIPLQAIRTEADVAVVAEHVSDNDGWPCLPFTER